MTRAKWKKHILGCLAVSLDGEIDNGSEWLFTDKESGEPLSEVEEKRMRAAVRELQDEFYRRRNA